jgi:endo-1,4-beta-D-glucanase Y
MRALKTISILYVLLFSASLGAQVYLPNHLSSSQKFSQAKNYYTYWRQKYLKPSNNFSTSKAYFVEMYGSGGVDSEGNKTTSEAMGYGMLIAVLGHKMDSQSQSYFDGLFRMYSRHKSINSKYLMSWVIHKSESLSEASTSATDGDFDIALALILADRVWTSKGQINYLYHAKLLINEILKNTINQQNNKIMLGDWWSGAWGEASRPSDWMGGHLVEFYKLTGNQKFLTVRDQFYNLSRQIQSVHSPQTGLIPDFISTKTNQPGPAYLLESQYDDDYYYNSARVPLRFILDYQKNQNSGAKTTLLKMIDFFYKQSQGSILNIKSGYTLKGQVIGNYFDTAFVAPIVAGATVDKKYQSFVNQGWDQLVTKKQNYFSDSLNMLTLFYLNGSWIN